VTWGRNRRGQRLALPPCRHPLRRTLARGRSPSALRWASVHVRTTGLGVTMVCFHTRLRARPATPHCAKAAFRSCPCGATPRFDDSRKPHRNQRHRRRARGLRCRSCARAQGADWLPDAYSAVKAIASTTSGRMPPTIRTRHSGYPCGAGTTRRLTSATEAGNRFHVSRVPTNRGLTPIPKFANGRSDRATTSASALPNHRDRMLTGTV
jgi:hypothetical protein